MQKLGQDELMVVVSWKLQFEPLSAAGSPRCVHCGNRAPHLLVQKKRGVKVMFVPVYKGSAGYATLCTICSHISPIDDEKARITLLRYLGEEEDRLYMSRHMQTASARLKAAQVLMAYLNSDQCKADVGSMVTSEMDVGSMVTSEMSEDLVQIRLHHCMAWRLAEAEKIPFTDAEVVIFEDCFNPAHYVDEALNVLVDPATLDRKITSIRTQHASVLPRLS